MKKKIIKATIQLIIGLILLGLVWYYSSLTPDRQRTLINQFNVLITQIKILFYNFLWEGKYAREKVNFQMSMDSLINLWKKSWCLTGKDLETLDKIFKELKKISPTEFENNKIIYYEIYHQFAQKIQNKCPNVKFYK